MTSIQPNGKEKRITIGLFLGQLEERYQSWVWPSVVEAAKKRGVNLTCFPGGPLNINYDHLSQRNVVYNFASSQNLDGLLIMSGTLANHTDNAKISAFCNQYQPLPLVSIALAIEGIPSIVIDNTKGIYDVTAHLIREHKLRRIAFIRGPKGHKEAEQRYQSYIDTLAEFGIPFDPAIVAQGNFVHYSGIEAVRILLDERRAQFDAIVAANDRMAMGAVEALSTRGIKIPEDIAVVGFDDIEDVRFTVPPLTTSIQPLRQQGEKAIDLLLAQIYGEIVPQQISLPTELVIRQSCGCRSSIADLETNHTSDTPELRSLLAGVPDSRRGQVIEEIKQSRIIPGRIHDQVDNDWANQLLDAYLDDIETKNGNEFLHTLDNLLQQATDSGDAISPWQNIISTLRKYSLPMISTYEDLLRHEALWEQARTLISEKAELSQGRAKLRTVENSLLVSEIGQSLLTTFDLDQLLKLIKDAMPRLRIPGCIIAIYEEDPQINPQVKILLAYHQEKTIPENLTGQSLHPEQLISGELFGEDQPRFLVIDPLYIQDEQLGLVIFEMGPIDGITYETLRRQISSALKGTLLLRDREHATNELEKYRDYLEELVRERTNDLIRANELLQREIEERIRAEKEILRFNEELENRVVDRTALLEAANKELEAFSYSVSHDLRAPLRAINGYAQILLDDFQTQLSPEGQEFLERIQVNTGKMDQLIQTLLAFSRLGRQEIHKSQTNCKTLAEAVITELSIENQDRQINIIVEELPVCQADPALLKQVFFNLISNAIKFSQYQESVNIHIGSTKIKDKDVIFVRDNGIGFDMNQTERLFGVFQRLHSPEKFEGEGIGLATVQRIIARHGGQVWAEAEAGKGATFFFTVA